MNELALNSNAIRKQFLSLLRKYHNLPRVFMDGPAGTQVPQSVIDAIADYNANSNANSHGTFITKQETDQLIEGMRYSIASLLGAEAAETISIGQNMTTLITQQFPVWQETRE